MTEFEGKEYPISHFFDHSPVHLVGCRISIDKRTPGAAGAAKISPHGLVQEFLNRSDDHLWAFVSNGHYLRILRDNVSLTRQAYVEFDLKAMMDGQVYSDYRLLWLICHSSRVLVPEDKTPEACWLEKWSQHAQQQGTRAMESLRSGVEKTISTLGSGFLACRTNDELRNKLRAGNLEKQDYYRQLLRIVYRLIFLFVTEDRDLLFSPDSSQEAQQIYTKYYSTRRLRQLAQKKRGTQHRDIWKSISLIFQKLNKEGCSELGLPALGSFLWNPEFTKDLNNSDISNNDLLETIRDLAFVIDDHSLRQVDFKNLGSEELGSVYESLLELHPDLYIDPPSFELKTTAGSERKTTGSYYTPTTLINCLLDSALDPVIDQTVKEKGPEKVILNLKVCDPACGSGHFLVAAAHRIAKRLASIRSGDGEPSPKDTRHALREVISHCIYGVDINPMSVELCKISLWLEAIEPGKPLSFLDHHIKCGNSLLGTTPALMAKGIPDEAFKPIEGDDKAVCNVWKKQNKDEKKGQNTMFSLFDDGREYPLDKLGTLSTAYNEIEEYEDDDIASQEQKQKQYEKLVKSSSYEFGHLLTDAWCSAFVIEKNKEFSYGITEKVYREIEKNPHSLAPWLKNEIKHLARQYQFFHWHLEFPSVFKVPMQNSQPENDHTGLSGGFNCILGNPPWERTALEELEFFSAKSASVLEAPTTAKRKKIIENLKDTDPVLYSEYLSAKRKSDGDGTLITNSNKYPYGSRGRLNTYAVFVDLSISLLNLNGRLGIIVPTGLAVDAPMEPFWEFLISNRRLVSLIDFENKKPIFPDVHREQKFCLLALRGSPTPVNNKIKIGFWLKDLNELNDPQLVYDLPEESLLVISPNTRQPLLTRNQKDVHLSYYIRLAE